MFIKIGDTIYNTNAIKKIVRHNDHITIQIGKGDSPNDYDHHSMSAKEIEVVWPIIVTKLS